MNINEVMCTDVKSCRPDSSLEEVARLMWDNDCGAIPVVNEDGTLAGIASMGDLVAFTGDGSARAKRDTAGIPADEVLEMLKHVSAHHAGQGRPVAQLSV